MPSSILEVVPAVPVQAAAKAKVTLIAWDPESPAHTERMVQQRIACGWNEDLIEQWRVLQREGNMALQWVVISGDSPEKEAKLAQHLLEYPGEAAPIVDTATTLAGKPRIPSSQSFIPVGHISLDSESPNPDQADASKGLYCITAFYISRAIHGVGLGSATMTAIETEAVNEPFCAKVLSLDTMANESTNIKEMWAYSGLKQPPITTQDWYGRRGYKVCRFMKGHIQFVDGAGKLWSVDIVFMKKTIG